jgi:hypothetical protein
MLRLIINNMSWEKELKELLKCDDNHCQEGHYPLGMDENDDVVWGGCPNCVVGSNYLPRVNPYKLEQFIKDLRKKDEEELIKTIKQAEYFPDKDELYIEKLIKDYYKE